MIKRAFALAVLVSGLAAFSPAAPPYRIALRGKTDPVLARDKPVARGSVVLFHRYSDGRLTSVPVEDVAGFVASDRDVAVQRPARRRAIVGTADTAVAIAPVRPLEPGEVRVVGVTGAADAIGGAGSAGAGTAPMPGASSRDVAARSAIDAQVFPGDLPAPNPGAGAGTMAGTAYGQNAAGQPVLNQPVLNPTLSGSAPANGAAQSATQPINPNGFPATTTTGAQSGGQPINPNGFPATTTTGPQSGAQPIDSNGFPSTAQPAQNVNGQPAQNTNQPAQTGNGQTTAQPAQNGGQVQPNTPNTNAKPGNPNGGAASKQ